MPKNHAAQVEPAGRVARKPKPKPVLPPIPKAPNLNPFINEGKPADPLPVEDVPGVKPMPPVVPEPVLPPGVKPVQSLTASVWRNKESDHG